MRDKINKYLSSFPLEDNNTALLLSGGIDSLTCLFSLLDMGVRPTCYTFRLTSRESDDFNKAKALCERFALPFCPVLINDNDDDILLRDVRYIIKHFDTKKKTCIQVLHGFLYLVKAIKEKYVVSGICADTLHGTSREFAMANSRSKEEFLQKKANAVKDINDSSYAQIKQLLEENGKCLIAPYKDCAALVDFFLPLSCEDTTKPCKRQSRIAYPELEEYRLIRPPRNLQIGSGIREWHDNLLKRRKGNSIIKVYNEIYNDILNEKAAQIQLSLAFE